MYIKLIEFIMINIILSDKNTPQITTKWSGALLTGNKLTDEQTFEIISKCDPLLQANLSKLTFGNNHSFIKEARNFTLLEQLSEHLIYEYNQKNVLISDDYAPFNVSLLSSCWIGGTNSWLLKDGTVFYHSNIGSWTSTNDVVEYWTKMAQVFPFLDLNMTVFDCELNAPQIIVIQNELKYIQDDEILTNNFRVELDNETKQMALFNLSVKDGKVAMLPPDLSVHDGKIPSKKHLISLRSPNPDIYECYLDSDMVANLMNHTRKQVIQFLQDVSNELKNEERGLVNLTLMVNNQPLIQFFAKPTENLWETLRWKIGKYVGSNKLYDFRKKIFSNEFKRENDIFIQDFIDYIQNSQFANLGYKTIQLEDGLVAHIKPFDLTQI